MQSILDPKWHVFIKVAELGSLTRAATAFDVPQSMISRHVAQLEAQCNARLFRRTGRGVVLTDFGEQVFPRVKALVAEADVLADDIRTSGGLPVGEVRVGLLPFTVPILTGPLFTAVRDRFPKIRLHLAEAASAQLDEQLREGRLDMSLLLRDEDVGTHEPVLKRLALFLVGHPDHPVLKRPTIEFDALQHLPLILPSPPHVLRERLDRLAKARNIQLTVAVEADSIRLQHEVAAAGGGFAITVGAQSDIDKRRLSGTRIVKPVLQRSVVLGTATQRPHTLATREVHRLVQQLASTLLNR